MKSILLSKFKQSTKADNNPLLDVINEVIL